MTFVLITGCGYGGACKRLLFDPGLPGSLLLSSLAQCALIFGAWLLWSVWRRPS